MLLLFMKHIKGYLIYKLVIILLVCIRYFIPYDSDWFYLWFYAVWGSISSFEYLIAGPMFGILLQTKHSISIIETILMCPIIFFTTYLTIYLGHPIQEAPRQIAVIGTVLFLIFNIITRLWKNIQLGKSERNG